MSVTIDAFLVDWNELEAKYKERGDNLNFWETLDEEEQWLESWDYDGWEISFTAAMGFSDIYKALRPKIAESERAPLDQFLTAFIVTNDDEAFTPVQDIGADVDKATIFGSMNPESVRKYLDLYKSLNLGILRKPFNEYKGTTDYAILFDDFEQCISYIKLWGSLLQAADNKGRGIVFFCG